jgi:hypothetical protein
MPALCELAAKAAVSTTVTFALLAQLLLVQASRAQLPTIGTAAYSCTVRSPAIVCRADPHPARTDFNANALRGQIGQWWSRQGHAGQDQKSRRRGQKGDSPHLSIPSKHKSRPAKDNSIRGNNVPALAVPPMKRSVPIPISPGQDFVRIGRPATLGSVAVKTAMPEEWARLCANGQRGPLGTLRAMGKRRKR